MILRRLYEYANRIELPPLGYSMAPARWYLDVTTDGTPEGFVQLGGDKRGLAMAVPDVIRGSEVAPKILADNAEYALGIPRPNATAKQLAAVPKKHQSFVALVRRCAEETGEPSVLASLRFLERWDSGEYREMQPDDLSAGGTLVFRIEGVVPIELPSVQRFWADASARSDAVTGQCLVTGEHGMIEIRLPVKIKGVPGGQPTGTSLVSANNPATEHYGLSASLNFPISRAAAEKYGKALNYLLADQKSRVRIGPLIYTFWTQQPEDLADFASFLTHPDPERVRELLLAPYAGQEQHGIEGNDFYALALSASGGRVVVRDFLETTVPEVEENLKRWFGTQRHTDPWGQEGMPLGIFALAASAYFDAEDIQPRVLTSLLQTALEGTPLSTELLSRTVARNRAEGDMTRPRAVLISIVLNYTKGGEMVEQTTAYQCGRLLAELAAAQRAAVPSAETTIVDRYYGAASSTPATIFGLLLRNTQPHLDKLRRDKPGAAYAIEGRIEEITSEIGADFPRTLTLREQAQFALGFYNQRAANRAAAKAATAVKNENRQEGMEVS